MKSTDDAEDTSRFTVLKDGKLIMIVEVKKTVNTNLVFIDAQDVIELLVYCQYLMRLHGLSEILGTLTDGRVWHTMKMGIQELSESNVLEIPDLIKPLIMNGGCLQYTYHIRGIIGKVEYLAFCSQNAIGSTLH